MDTTFLESFVAVVDHGSIAEAARRLNLTPAAVAQRIHALEREFDAPLLARSGRTVKPTETGARILERARQFLQEARDLKAYAAGDTTAGQLRVGAIATALNTVVPDILALLARQYPQLKLYVLPGASDTLFAQVRSGDLDAAIVVEPDFAIPKTCGWQVLREEPLIVLAPSSLRISDPDTALRSQPFIRYDRNARGGRIADSYLRRAGIQPRESFELTSLAAIALMVDRGLGISLVPDWPPPWPEGLKLKKLPIAGTQYVRRLGLVWPHGSIRTRLIRAFLGAAIEVIDQEKAGRPRARRPGS